MTVGLPHPEAYTVMMSGKTEITSHIRLRAVLLPGGQEPGCVPRHEHAGGAQAIMSILLAMTQRRFADANCRAACVPSSRHTMKPMRSSRTIAMGRWRRTVRASTQLKVPRDELLGMLADAENMFQRDAGRQFDLCQLPGEDRGSQGETNCLDGLVFTGVTRPRRRVATGRPKPRPCS